MLLTVDIGNTNIVIGLYEKNLLKHKWRIISDHKKSVDDYAVDIIELCLTNQVDCLNINGCIIASVVPILTSRIHEAIKKFISETVAKKILIILKIKLEIWVAIKWF